jgi:hypothetical protein
MFQRPRHRVVRSQWDFRLDDETFVGALNLAQQPQARLGPAAVLGRSSPALAQHLAKQAALVLGQEKLHVVLSIDRACEEKKWKPRDRPCGPLLRTA